MTRRRRTVRCSLLVQRRGALWAYGYADLAVLLGMREGAVRQAVRRGRLDPGDLRSVIEYARRRAAT